MSLEPINCQQCGSGSVTEFKPGSYVCSHCEAIFKRAASTNGNGAGCEVGECGVAAVGRCAECGRAFCATHQAPSDDFYRPRPYVDWCTACQQARRTRAREAGERNLQSWKQAVRARLQEAGDPVEYAVVGAACFPWKFYDNGGALRARLRDMWNEVFPSSPLSEHANSWELPWDRSPPWDAERIPTWFARRAAAAGIAPPETARWSKWERGLLGKRLVTHEAPAWAFTAGWYYSGEDQTPRRVHVLADGQVPASLHEEPENYIRSPFVLIEMAKLLRLLPEGCILEEH